jgi:rhodanese-related sulfurtransferase
MSDSRAATTVRSSSPPHPPDVPPLEISPQDVAGLLSRSADFLFIDCRSPEEHEVARIDGARLMPYRDIDLHVAALRQFQNKLIVVHCHTGRRSRNMTLVLRDQGFTNARSMAGGIDRWSREIDPGVPRYEKQSETQV